MLEKCYSTTRGSTITDGRWGGVPQRALTLRELCAVIAHELGHVKNRDYARSMHIKIATAGLGGIYTAGHALYRRAENRYVRIAVIPPAFALMLIGFASQIIAHLLRLADCRMAEFRADAVAADAFGAQTTIAALKKASPSCSTIADEGDLWSTHPSIEARISRLKETPPTSTAEAFILRTYSLEEWLELERSNSEK